MKKLMSVLIIVGLLACCISFMIIVYALPGDRIWTKTFNPSGYNDAAVGVTVDGTGLYIVGYDQRLGSGDARWRIEKRSLADGSLIWKKTVNPSSGWDGASDVAVDSTGVYIVGYDSKPGEGRWRVEKRSLTDGSRIWVKTSNPSGDMDVALGVAVDSTGVYIVGYDRHTGDTRWRVEKRSLTDGSLIWLKTSNPTIGGDVAYDVSVDDSGVYIVGKDSTSNGRWRMEKRSTTDGSRIWLKTSNPSSGMDEAYGVAVDGSGVYVVGSDYRLGNNRRWRMEKRSTTDGSRIWVKTCNPSSDHDEALGVAVDGSGVYIVGYDEKPGEYDFRWRIEKRSTTDGSRIWSKTCDPSIGKDSTPDVAVDGTGVYVVGHDARPGINNYRWRIEKRYL